MKIYQPIVLERAEELTKIIKDSGFMEQEDITDVNIVKEFFCNKLTEKFIEGYDLNEKGLFTEDEMVEYLQQIIIKSTLISLKQKGLIESYEDENTEEVFFLTKEGKEFTQKINLT